MAKRSWKTFSQYLHESLDHDPALAEMYEETRIEGQLAESLVHAREERGLTQRQLAAESGIAQPVISRIERGAETPTLVTLQKLMKALDAKVEISAHGVKIQIADISQHQTNVAINSFLGSIDVGQVTEHILATLQTAQRYAPVHARLLQPETARALTGLQTSFGQSGSASQSPRAALPDPGGNSTWEDIHPTSTSTSAEFRREELAGAVNSAFALAS